MRRALTLGVYARGFMANLDHEKRKDRLTGSTVAAYLGYSPYCSPREQWELNNGRRIFAGNRATEIGKFVEEGLARFTQKDLKLGTMKQGHTINHPEMPEFWAATPDYLFSKDHIGLQIKNHWPHMAKGFVDFPGKRGEWDNELVPMYHQMQCQWERACYEAVHGREWKVWLLGCYFGGADFRVYRIRRDEKLLNAMTRVGIEFWRDHLDPTGPCTEPSNAHWQKAQKEKPRTPKMSTAELAAAPVMFSNE